MAEICPPTLSSPCPSTQCRISTSVCKSGRGEGQSCCSYTGAAASCHHLGALANLISSVPTINRDFLTSGRCICLNFALAAQVQGVVPDMRLPVFWSLCCSKGAGKDGILLKASAMPLRAAPIFGSNAGKHKLHGANTDFLIPLQTQRNQKEPS